MPLDRRGLPLKVGDEVAFAALHYRSSVLRAGPITEFDENREDSVRVRSDYDGKRRWHHPEWLVLLPPKG